MTIPHHVYERLLFILHRGLVEARLLAQAGRTQQIFDLADALEPLPGWMASWNDEHLDATRLNLQAYATKYPDAFRYIDYVDMCEPPTAF
jgi:hypothetical protein